jgi:hypothetical protein
MNGGIAHACPGQDQPEQDHHEQPQRSEKEHAQPDPDPSAPVPEDDSQRTHDRPSLISLPVPCQATIFKEGFSQSIYPLFLSTILEGMIGWPVLDQVDNVGLLRLMMTVGKMATSKGNQPGRRTLQQACRTFRIATLGRFQYYVSCSGQRKLRHKDQSALQERVYRGRGITDERRVGVL